MQSNYITASIMILIIVTSSALAGEEVVMTITAHNPSRDKAQEIEVREILSPHLSPSDVLRTGLDLQVDPKTGRLCLYKKVNLKPVETMYFSVELLDVWQVPQKEIDQLRKRAEVATIPPTEKQNLMHELDHTLAMLAENEKNNRLSTGVTPEEHIRGYERSFALLNSAGDIVGRMERMAEGLTYVEIKMTTKSIPPSFSILIQKDQSIMLNGEKVTVEQIGPSLQKQGAKQESQITVYFGPETKRQAIEPITDALSKIGCQAIVVKVKSYEVMPNE